MPILLLDDEESFRTALAGNLRDDGHEVLEYEGAGQIPSLLEVRAGTVAITDYEMRGEDGLSFADRFHQAYQDVPVILVTAYWSPQIEAQAISRSYVRLLLKPVDYDELHELVHRLACAD